MGLPLSLLGKRASPLRVGLLDFTVSERLQATAATSRRLPASDRLRRSLSNGRVTAALILLLPALLLFTLFVMLPLGESAYYSVNRRPILTPIGAED